MYYSAIDILAILVLLIENQGILTKRGAKFKQPTLRSYKRFLVSALAYFVTDAAWGVAEHLKNSPLALFSVTSVYFVAMALSVTCWIGFILSCLDEGAKLKKFLTWTGRVFAAGVAVLVVVNIFTPVMFTVDENCAYQALSGRYIILLIQIIVLLFLSCYAFFVIFKRKTGEIKKYNNLALFGVIMASFLIAQLYFPFLPLYAIAYLLGICLLHTYVINDEKDIFEKEMEEAKKISALRQSFNSLFDNMPVNAYSKDIETGEYLACNRSFAKYVHLNSPEEIIGQTDYELFDSKTAAHFIEVDKTAAESNKPYTIFEDVFDTDGNPRQFQTTKLTFIDESGRRCILGMSMDITETIKAKKENEATKAAYLEALNSSAVYENIVGILSKDYFDLYYINLETNNYIEYGSKSNDENAPNEKRGDDFFKSVKNDAPKLVYEEDLPKILELLDKETLLREIEEQGIFIYYYRLMIDGKPNYVCLKATRVAGDSNYIIIGISNVDSQMKSRIDIENAKKEKMAYERLSAFSRNIIALYMVDTESDEYVCYSSTDDFDELGISESGGNFFDETYQNSLNAVFEDDREMFHHTFTKKNILNSINLDGVFVMDYRLVIGGEPKYVRLKATEFEENGKASLVIGIEDVDSYVRREQQQASELSQARELATKDALTGVKNSYAFVREKEHLKDLIDKGEISELAVVICDINGLKTVNDTKGHQFGDELIKNACATICNIFKHSSVFRIGGDEFAIICRGQDYENIAKLLEEMDSANISNNGVEIAYGMAKYSSSTTLDEVIHNADSRMYDYKSALKTNKGAVLGSITPEQPTLYEFPEDLKKAYESSPLSFVYYQNINDRAVPVLFSEGFCRNVGIARENIAQWLSNDMFERMHPDDVGVVAQVSDDFLHQTAPYDTVFRCRLDRRAASQGDDEYVYIHGTGKWQTMPDGTELAVITYSNLSLAQKFTLDKMSKYMMLRKDRFYTDPLTNIPNINYINEFGGERIQTLLSEGKTPMVAYIDIYSMQSYNSQYGVSEGDKLICLTAKSLEKHFPSALIARAVDDHFVMICSPDSKEELEQALAQANIYIRKNAYGNTSGIRSGVCAVEEGISFSLALDRSKMAMKHIQNDMNRVVEFFSEQSKETYLMDRYIIENLPKALNNNYIKVHYHSLHRVESQKVAAFECLARWIDPHLGMIYPDDFIPVLNKYHQLYKLDLYMFEQACKETRNRCEKGLPIVPVSINFSRRDFDYIDIVGEMNRIYDEYNLSEYVDKSYFIVEITEQDLGTAKDNFGEQLIRIRENNYRLWLDDFGSGYSAISIFAQYDFDLVKIDMNLLSKLDIKGGVNRIILKDLVELLKKLGIHTLAEGLETEEQLEFIKKIGCELAQGYYYHKPEPVETIVKRLESGDVLWQCESDEEREVYSRKWFE